MHENGEGEGEGYGGGWATRPDKPPFQFTLPYSMSLRTAAIEGSGDAASSVSTLFEKHHSEPEEIKRHERMENRDDASKRKEAPNQREES
jgi:hypothetical protein